MPKYIIGIIGADGTGKTTLIQKFLEEQGKTTIFKDEISLNIKSDQSRIQIIEFHLPVDERNIEQIRSVHSMIYLFRKTEEGYPIYHDIIEPFIKFQILIPLNVALNSFGDTLINLVEQEHLTSEIKRLLPSYNLIESEVILNETQQNSTSLIFYRAYRSIRFPLNKIYNRLTSTFTESFALSLVRSFYYFDRDKDGFLNMNEIRELYQFFHCEISEDLIYSHYVLLSGDETNPTIMYSSKIYRELISLFIERDGTELCYDLDKFFQKNYYPPFQPIGIPSGWNESTFKFIQQIFQLHDEQKNGYLNEKEVNSMFLLCDPSLPPWIVLQNREVSVPLPTNQIYTFNVFLSLWSICFRFDPSLVYNFFCMLGYRYYCDFYDKNTLTNTFCHGFVVGSKGCGKTTWISQFVQYVNLDEINFDNKSSVLYSGANTILKQNQLNIMIMTEVSEQDFNQNFSTYQKYCHVVYILFDVISFDSAKVAVEISKNLPSEMKRIFIGTHSDLIKTDFQQTPTYKYIKAYIDENDLLDILEYNNKTSKFSFYLLYDVYKTKGLGSILKHKGLIDDSSVIPMVIAGCYLFSMVLFDNRRR